MAIHKGTLCDNCGLSPIIGNRYSCLLCNFDVCDYCESICSSKVHPVDHPLIKIKVPYKSIDKKFHQEDDHKTNVHISLINESNLCENLNKSNDSSRSESNKTGT